MTDEQFNRIVELLERIEAKLALIASPKGRPVEREARPASSDPEISDKLPHVAPDLVKSIADSIRTSKRPEHEEKAAEAEEETKEKFDYPLWGTPAR